MTDFLEDPLWYKDAVIYELHVRSFNDSNNDGFGDFEGLRQKLPYLDSLGVNTLWLLPFLESPLKDDGYDTADYYKILPVHGDLDDFKAFMEEAHARGMRVITELVLNHTSDQHPWFQEARDPESDKHDWYVWSDTTEKYEDVRIIFTDTEDSNWSWDRKAQKYYWHRFFSHQPDLNFDNPEVREKMKEVMFFWFDMGIDGLRLDAIPYLFEREGTNCENLPETIEYVKELRQAVDERYGPGKVLLAEANQWPEDTLPYFGDGDGVQMAFNFPIMPRLYMSLRRENRRPLIEMMEHTSEIPDDAQWALFLRNHDELTLEMVTDEERDYMYHEYAADSRFRINVGIRRRLAPLLGGDRDRIELMNALLFSLPGSPIVYYGDEIGMGDDPFLGDRNGVRTPMQWSPDKNGGFSRAPHHRLFMPPINRGKYSYEFVNTEDAENDEHSLLHFMRRIIAHRQQHKKVFGRGSIEHLSVENQSILCFVREYEGEQILVIANLSRYAQSVHLPAKENFEGMVPVEMFSQTNFPAFTDEPYHIVLGPHGFYWFALKPQEVVLEEAERHSQLQLAEAGERGKLPVLKVEDGLENLLVRTMARGRGPEQLESLLPDYIANQRWFGATRESIQSVSLADAVRLQEKPFPVYLSIIKVELETETLRYVLPLALSYEDANAVLNDRPNTALAWVDGVPAPPEADSDLPEGRGLLHDATVNHDFWTTLFRWWKGGGRSRSLQGLYEAQLSEEVRDTDPENVRLLTGEQSNSAAILNERYFVKLYRRLEFGTNPETELLNYLTRADFKFTPRLHGTIGFKRARHRYTIGVLQEALPVETDGWGYALEMTNRVLNRVSGSKPPEIEAAETEGKEVPIWLEDVAPEMLTLARTLGIRTAELHLTLSQAGDKDLHPVSPEEDTYTNLANRIREEANLTKEQLSKQRPDKMPSDDEWKAILDRLDILNGIEPEAQRIRIHGDFHLGQVLRADGEFYLLDFEGEPIRTLEERRSRDNPLRDVAGMMRSIEYAVLAAWQDHESSEETEAYGPAEAWTAAIIQWCQSLFLDSYLDTAGDADFLPPPEAQQHVLWAYLLDKVLYEVRYELGHRPDWLWLPMHGLRRFMQEAYSPVPSTEPERHEKESAANEPAEASFSDS